MTRVVFLTARFSELIQAYRSEAEMLCSNIIDALTKSTDQLVTDQSQLFFFAQPCTSTNTVLVSDAGLRCLVFHGRLALELSTTSPFPSGIGCDDVVAESKG